MTRRLLDRLTFNGLRPSKTRKSRQYGYDANPGPRSTLQGHAHEGHADVGAVIDESARRVRPLHKRRNRWVAIGQGADHATARHHGAARTERASGHNYVRRLKELGFEHKMAPQAGGMWPPIVKWGSRFGEAFGVGLLVSIALAIDPVDFPFGTLETVGISLTLGLALAMFGEGFGISHVRWNFSRTMKRFGDEGNKVLWTLPEVNVGLPYFIGQLLLLTFVVAFVTGIFFARQTFQELLGISSGVALDPRLGLAGGLLSLGGLIANVASSLAWHDPLHAPYEASNQNFDKHMRRGVRSQRVAAFSWQRADFYGSAISLAWFQIAVRAGATGHEAVAQMMAAAGEEGVVEAIDVAKDLADKVDLPDAKPPSITPLFSGNPPAPTTSEVGAFFEESPTDDTPSSNGNGNGFTKARPRGPKESHTGSPGDPNDERFK